MVLDNDIPDMPDFYHELIVITAAIDCFIKDSRDPSLLVAKKEFYEKQMDEDADERTLDSPRSVVVTEGGDWGGWGSY
jgi:hypothetical protein